MPRYNLFDNVLIGNKGTMNNTQMRNYNFRVKLKLTKSSKYAMASESIKDSLEFQTQNLSLNDYHIPFSYVRIEIDSDKSTKLYHNKIIKFGTENNQNYFDNNIEISTQAYDYIYIHQAMDTCPLDKLLSKLDDKFTMTLANLSDVNGFVELKVTLYYHYLGSNF
jgi:hypothetical protein